MDKLKDGVLVLLRLNLGILFASTGWGKVHDLATVTGFFTDLHIPFPAFNAVLVGYTELIGGVLLVIGLATRLAALPLIISMIVAILTAKLPDITGVADLASTDELTYALVLCVLVVFGAGRLSGDSLVRMARDRVRARVDVPLMPAPSR